MINLLKKDKELWDLFTRREEYDPIFLDQYDRFPYSLSSHRNVLDPKVSKFLLENNLEIEYPEEKKFAVCMTHDIDNVYYSRLRVIYSSFKYLQKLQIKNAMRMVFNNTHKKWNVLWNFNDIMNIEKKYEAKSSFFFLALKEDEQDFRYRIENLEYEIGNIVDNGFEVCLHGGQSAYNDLDVIIEEKQRLEKISGERIIGYRNHYVMFKVPDTWEMLSKAGFEYDATFGYADMVGFRNGMCHPYFPFNLITNKEINILEIPLNIMDTTFDEYLPFDINGQWEIIKYLIDTVEKYNGVISIIWHNENMIGDKLKLFEKILDYCYKKNAWITSGEEIWNFWKNTYG